MRFQKPTEHRQRFPHPDAETQETRLYSYYRKAKKNHLARPLHVHLEDALDKLNTGLDKKGTVKNYAKIHERISRRSKKTGQKTRIEVIADDEKNNAIRINWQRESKSAQRDQHCAVFTV